MRRRPLAGWQPLTTLAGRAARRHLFNDRLTAAQVCRTAATLSDPSFSFIPLSFRDGVLKLGVTSYDALVTGRLQVDILRRQLNERLSAAVVREIKITVQPPDQEDDR